MENNVVTQNKTIPFFYLSDRAPSEDRVRHSSIFPGSLSTDGEGKSNKRPSRILLLITQFT